MRPAPAVIAWIRSKIGPRLTEDERKQPFLGLNPLSIPGYVKYTVLYADSVLMFTVLFVYSVLHPIANLILFPAFLFLQLVYRHQMIYIYDPRNDTGGKLWPAWSGWFIVSLLIAQVTVMAVLAVNEYGGAPFMLPLIIATVLFWRYLQPQHWRVASALSISLSHTTDLANEEGKEGWEGAYKQAALASTAAHGKAHGAQDQSREGVLEAGLAGSGPAEVPMHHPGHGDDNASLRASKDIPGQLVFPVASPEEDDARRGAWPEDVRGARPESMQGGIRNPRDLEEVTRAPSPTTMTSGHVSELYPQYHRDTGTA